MAIFSRFRVRQRAVSCALALTASFALSGCLVFDETDLGEIVRIAITGPAEALVGESVSFVVTREDGNQVDPNGMSTYAEGPNDVGMAIHDSEPTFVFEDPGEWKIRTEAYFGGPAAELGLLVKAAE